MTVRDELRQAWRRVRPLVSADVARGERGVALLIVLVMVALMSAFSTEFSYNTRVHLRMASNLERDVQAYYHARSSVEISRMVIRYQQTLDQFAGLMGGGGQNIEMWNYACKFAEIYNTGKVELFGADLFDLGNQTGIGVENGSFECTANAEDGKVNVNAIESPQQKKNIFGQLFGYLQGPRPEGMGLTEEDKERAELIFNIMDWADPDQARTDIDLATGTIIDGAGGAEDTDYAKHDYECKNAKLDSVDELRLVEGMDDETFCKVREKVTVYSTEKLNVNTADIGLLSAVLCGAMSPEQQQTLCLGPSGIPGVMGIDLVAAQIEQCRRIKKDVLWTTPFPQAQSFFALLSKIEPPLGPVQVNTATLAQVIGTKSRVIRIDAIGKVANTEKRISAVIDTSTGKYVYWRED